MGELVLKIRTLHSLHLSPCLDFNCVFPVIYCRSNNGVALDYFAAENITRLATEVQLHCIQCGRHDELPQCTWAACGIILPVWSVCEIKLYICIYACPSNAVPPALRRSPRQIRVMRKATFPLNMWQQSQSHTSAGLRLMQPLLLDQRPPTFVFLFHH